SMVKFSLVSLRHVTLALSLGFALALVAPTPAAAQDADKDGVPDLVDQCPGTPALELVNSTGCSVCPCDAAWASHTAYYNCVAYQASLRPLSKSVQTAVLTHAKNSTCGMAPTFVRCCTWSFRAKTGSMGTCLVKDSSQCTPAILNKWAEPRGTGSCYYNPCTWYAQ